MVRNALQLHCCKRTVANYMNKEGPHSRKAAKKIELTAVHRERRVLFATENLNRNWGTTEDFATVFVDEKVFCSDEDGMRLKPLWRKNGMRYAPQNILPVRRSGRISLGFWGWMSEDGPGELIEVGGRMNSQQYVAILRDTLIPSVTRLYGDVSIILIQDNSSVHNSRIVRNFIEDEPRLELLRWPVKSPDINPIENLWGIMVREWEWNPRLRTREALFNHATMVWEGFRGRDTCQRLVDSMPRRLQKVIDTNGNPIGY